jgi:hypothetical protein
MKIELNNNDLSEESLSTLDTIDRARVKAAVFLIAAKESIELHEPLFAKALSVQAHMLLEPLLARKHEQAAAVAAKLKEEVNIIARDILALKENPNGSAT